uniref:SnoaL-like domain-containing protein n=1 Tax=Phaeomonas parva TaxID=124430 RepID=A0A6U4CXZ5_9STRA|mmetsp:Transcript_15629/g.47613  ORF Transcript_15629/g.47613 Transcript_15629/m.47613 type:complete len:173 (+) Transcript_15629:257-775(+)|eukprot:CAMPEP_0118888336 /NCGR_PEP_ID=MMETSP1163-20130328/25668_1 /TAXON_ID=124430 /ORGANISM="Phaeomonas parva, Strain CCMP2877" /LENGTH=172 /DNA_ID=CAMNT_0006826899 /DNA_START=201 /DNA_END=719 /DNA_ORIENTATION=+
MKVTSLVLAALVGAAQAVLPPAEVRSYCVDIFRTAFPHQHWVTRGDLEQFIRKVNPGDNYFSCPEGVEDNTLTNFSQLELFEWFNHNFDPDMLKYSETIVGDVSVSGNVCSFEKTFTALMSEDCYVSVMSRLFMEITDDGMVKRWVDHFDGEELGRQMTVCSLGRHIPRTEL